MIILLKGGADANAAAKDGDTALTFAASTGWVEGVRLLLDAGARMDCEAHVRGTPLMACVPEHVDAARLLIERGAALNACDRWGRTVLSNAVGHRPERRNDARQAPPAMPIVHRLDFKAPYGQSFISNTHDERDPEDLTALTLLLDAGANVNAKGRKACATPLIAAAARNAPDAVRLLVRRGADIDACDEQGRTALMIAAWHGHPRSVQALLECGADHSLRSDGGTTALMAASLPGEPDRMLQKLNSLPVAPSRDPGTEHLLQQLEELEARLGEPGDDVPTVKQLRRAPIDIRAAMSASLVNDIARQAHNRKKVIKILKGTGASD
jgi:ankyrin repeat protein